MKLNEKILNPDIEGVFKSLLKLSSLPWLSKDIADDIDLEYFYNQSGEKTLSPLGEKLSLDRLAKILSTKYSDKWNKLYDAFINSDYKPLENYSMHEEETPDLIDSTNGNDTKTSIGNGEVKQSTNIKQSSNGDSGIYGFNSNEVAVPSNTTNGTNETVGSLDDNQTKSNSNNTDTHVEQLTITHKGKRILTRSGNIGVTTSQQMLQSELDLRQWNFIDNIFKDVDSVLCLSIYE